MMVMKSFQYEKMVVHKKLLVKSELIFPFVDTFLYTLISWNFEWKRSIFYGDFFLAQSVHLCLI